MAQDVESHCKECTVCQQTKPMRVQMTNVPIGRPWQMIAMDILEGNRVVTACKSPVNVAISDGP